MGPGGWCGGGGVLMLLLAMVAAEDLDAGMYLSDLDKPGELGFTAGKLLL